MTKSTITKTWIGGLVTFAAGIVAAMVGVLLMLGYGGTFTQIADTNSYDFTPNINQFFWTTVTIIVIGGVIALAGGIVQLAAWIGALFNTYLVPDKAWFLIVLIGGLLSFFVAPLGFAAMLAYVIAGPDGSLYHQVQPTVPAQRPSPLAPTT